MLFERVGFARRGDKDGAAVLIDADELGDDEIALGQLPGRFAGRAVQVEVPETVALAPPQQAAVLHELVVVDQVDPEVVDRRMLGEYDLAGARRWIDAQHVEHGLHAVLALDVERPVGRPIDPRDVEIGRIVGIVMRRVLVAGQVDLHPLAAIGVHHEQLDHRVVAARDRVTLVEHPRPGCADCGAGDDPDAFLVGALDREAGVVGVPPVSGEALHFFLSDELGLAPADRIAFLRRDRFGLSADLADPQLPVPDEGNILAGIADDRVELAFLGVGQPRDRAVERCEIEVAIERHQHA